MYNTNNNPDIFTWKHYSTVDNAPRLNKHQNFEIPLQIQDSALKGTSSHSEYMEEITSRIHVRIAD